MIDNSFLSNKGLEDFQEEWEVFQKDNPDYDMKIYNTQNQTTSHIISAICYPRNSYGRVVIAPKWSPFLSFVGKNSKAPVFATQNVGLTNGVFGAYDLRCLYFGNAGRTESFFRVKRNISQRRRGY